MRSLLLILLLSLPAFSHGANMIKADEFGLVGGYIISGQIEKGDFSKLISLLRSDSSHIAMIYLSSAGGDVSEAMRIGRFAREYMLSATVLDECSSACFFIYSGAVHRRSFGLGGKIGLHRPRYDEEYFSSLSMDDAAREYRKLDISTRNYLEEMGVPRDIIDQMFSIPSDRIVYIRDEDILQKVGNTYAVFHEWIVAKCGMLTDDEERDLKAINALNILSDKDRLSTLDDKTRSAFVAVFADWVRYAESLSSGYRDYLVRKQAEWLECAAPVLRDEKSKVRQKYLKLAEPLPNLNSFGSELPPGYYLVE